MVDFLESNNKLNPMQFGFRPNRSTKLALTTFIEEVINNLDSKKPTHISSCFLDLSKAFDLVISKIEALKLIKIGIRGNCLDWILNYMSYRQQFVEIKHQGPEGINIL